MGPEVLFTDLETYHPALSVTDVGAHKYSLGCEVMLVGYKIDGGPAQVWDRTVDETVPRDIVIPWVQAQKVAYNCDFEREVYLNSMDWRSNISAWDDAAVLALTCGLPSNLDGVLKVLGWKGWDKKRGKQLINLFCQPAPKNHRVRRYTRVNRPDDWAEFVEYCRLDVEANARLWNELPHHTYERERENWLVDRAVNARGFCVDIELATKAIAQSSLAAIELNEELFDITGSHVASATQLAKLQEWLADCGVYTASLDRASIDALLTDPHVQGNARRALEIRQQVSQSSISKYAKAIEVACDCGDHERVFGGLRFYGANRTGRESGQLVQPQNMKRPGKKMETTKEGLDRLGAARDHILRETVSLWYPQPLDVLSSAVRTVIRARPGYKLVVSDLSNIEGRRGAVLGKEAWKVQAFREFDAGVGPDIYRLSYSRSFGVPLELVDKDGRQIGKVQELACQYQGALGAFHSMGALYGVRLPDSQAEEAVEFWRAAHPGIVATWRALQDAALAAVRNPNKRYWVGGICFRLIKWHGQEWLLVKLTNGRVLWYFKPRIVEGRFGNDAVAYYGNIKDGVWGWVHSYGGKWFENIVQAECRDILMPGIVRAETAGYAIVLHSHDELVAEVPDTSDYTVEALSACLTQAEPWYDDMPLAAAGYESLFYRKD